MGQCIITRRGGADKSQGLTATAEKIMPGYTALVNGSVLTGTATADADATAAGIVSGKTAYVNGAKITGTARLFPTVASIAGYSFGNEYTDHPMTANGGMPNTQIVAMSTPVIIGTYLRVWCTPYSGNAFYLFFTLA